MWKHPLLWLGIVLLAGLGAIVLIPAARLVVLGYVRNDRWYQGKPAGYWMQHLEDNAAGSATIDAVRRPEAVPVLVAILKDPANSDFVRTRAAEALGQIGPSAVPALGEALTHADAGVRWRAVRALREIGPDAQAASPALAELLKDPESFVRKLAAEALGKIGPQAGAAVPALVEALRDQDALVRQHVAEALGKIGPDARSAVPALRAALQDEDSVVGRLAAEALGNIGPDAKPTAPALTGALKNNDPVFRLLAAEALGKIGADAKEAVQVLLQLAQDQESEGDIRAMATAALKRMDPEAAARAGIR